MREEKCVKEGERALEKLRFNLERNDWNLEKDYGEELITVKSAYDQETKINIMLAEAVLDFASDWVFGDLVNHTLEATVDWNQDIKDHKVVQVRSSCPRDSSQGPARFPPSLSPSLYPSLVRSVSSRRAVQMRNEIAKWRERSATADGNEISPQTGNGGRISSQGRMDAGKKGFCPKY
ncbi:unnamed protein product [Darwinula stevensoni]|uniref:Uncharacterized protein n=1 Tax=Darwinula stevensoni TaxID=69355 RepID=A0A7R9AF74_9CRUS|nr:unnamed protein product [Darwinula stevensoni]CAG0902115.1 unnamed protein product [Darwinula stevensoni]